MERPGFPTRKAFGAVNLWIRRLRVRAPSASLPPFLSHPNHAAGVITLSGSAQSKCGWYSRTSPNHTDCCQSGPFWRLPEDSLAHGVSESSSPLWPSQIRPAAKGSQMESTKECTDLAPIETRVLRSLRRVGYMHVTVEHRGGGHVRIIGDLTSEGDRAIAMAVARTVTSVTDVTFRRE